MLFRSLVIYPIGPMERGEDVLLKEIFFIHIWSHVSQRLFHRSTPVRNGTDAKNALVYQLTISIMTHPVVILADELSSTSVSHSIHGWNEHEQGITPICTKLEFCICARGMSCSTCSIHRLGISKYQMHHRISIGVFR